MSLRTDYVDDMFSGNRKYEMIDNGDGTYSFNDVTEYSQVGSAYGAAQVNACNDAINKLSSCMIKTLVAGATTLTFTNSAFQSNTLFEFYTDKWAVDPKESTQNGTSLTLTFDAQDSNVTVCVRYMNIL